MNKEEIIKTLSVLRQLKIGMTEVMTLLCIEEETTPEEIVSKTNWKKVNIYEKANILKRKGYVFRNLKPNQKTAYTLTEKGKLAVKIILTKLEDNVSPDN